MKPPKNVNDLLLHLHCERPEKPQTLLADEDEQYLSTLIGEIRSGSRAVVLVETREGKIKYMFSNAGRPEALTILGKVVEATGRKIQDESEGRR